MILRTVAVIVALYLVNASAQARYSGGSGTAQDPYLIATAADLIALGEDPNDYDKHFVLTADLDLDPSLPGNRVFDRAVIAPDIDDPAIGSQTPAFAGTLDGQGHTIAGMVIDSNAPHAGLFGSIGASGCVSRLRLVRGSVLGQGRIGGIGGVDGVTGGVAAENRGLVIACGCEVIVNGAYEVGGLVGYNYSGTICACYSTGSVSSTGWYSHVGGLVGFNDGTISACYSTGSVSGVACFGGLVGSNAGTISTCYSVGSVGGHGSAGGLVGHDFGGTVSACFWNMQTSGRTTTTSAGGAGLTTSEMQAVSTFLNAGWDFLGESANGLCEYWQMPTGGGYPVLSVFNGYTPPALRGTGTANDPYLLGTADDLGAVWYRPAASYQLAADVDLSAIRWAMAVIPAFSGRLDGQGHRIAGLSIVGAQPGLIGYLAQGAVVFDLSLEHANVIGAGRCAGGLVARNAGTISACFSTGSISGTGSCVGGLVGYSDCGTISACYSTSSVSGTRYAGGLVGYNDCTTISACYSTGFVSSGRYAGGLVGHSDHATISACFWDTQTSGQTTSAGGAGRTAAQMWTAKTFLDAGWGIAGETTNRTQDIWWIDEGKDYPHLWWELTPKD